MISLIDWLVAEYGVSKDDAKRMAEIEAIRCKRDRALRHRLEREVVEIENELDRRTTEIKRTES
jgi:hypothetical protein